MLLPPSTGRGAANPGEMKVGDIADIPGSPLQKAQDSTGVSSAPAGTAGVAGWPEQKAPEQGRVGRGAGAPPGSSAGSLTLGVSIDGSCAESFREVTRWLQPAHAGAHTPWARRSTSAPVPHRASRLQVPGLIATVASD
jgi:hypothetical protein